MIRVLILDDDLLSARPLASRLRQDSNDEIEAVVCQTLDEALQVARHDPRTFDAFLIDKRLGAGKDGICAMEDLQRIRPDVEAIIFTGFDDPSDGYRALRAGAWGYLPKSGDLDLVPELIWRLRSLRELRMLNEMMNRTQRAVSLGDVSDIITKGSLWLGFERARLWLVDADTQTLERLSWAGTCGPADMPDGRTPIAEARYACRALEFPHNIACFRDEEFGPSCLVRSPAHGSYHPPVGEWVAVPLCDDARPIGLLVLDNVTQPREITADQHRALRQFRRAAAGALQRARLEEEQEQNAQRLRLLQRASEEMMQLADERGEEALWLAALTAATADYGLQFNRAALFLAKDGGTRLIGCAGVGHFDCAAAREAWVADRRASMTFDRFLSDLRRGALKPTPVHDAVRGWQIDLSPEGEGVFQAVLRSSRPGRVSAAVAAQRLPRPFVERFGIHDYAVVPLRVGSRAIGLAVVDNAHDGKPIRQLALDYLESLLAQAALTYEDYRQRKAHERLNALTCRVLSHADQPCLKATLNEICCVALEVSDVDCASVVPASEAGLKFTYEPEHAGSAGWQKVAEPVGVPRPDGVTEHALRTGQPIFIENVEKCDVLYAGRPIAEHTTLRQEGVGALICAPIRAVETDETLGAFRLYWRSPRTFTSADRTQAEMFARLAAVAIQHWRAAQHARATARAEVDLRERELTIHRRVMQEALMPDATKERVVAALLDAVHDVLHLPKIAVELHLLAWERCEDSKPRQVRHAYYPGPNGSLDQDTERNVFRGVIGRAFQSKRTQLVPDVILPEWRDTFQSFAGRETRSELAVPIVQGQAEQGQAEVVGVFNIESPFPAALGPAHAFRLERLAGVAALVLDNARRLEGRKQVLKVLKDIAAPIKLDRTMETIQKVVRDIAPDVSAFTIWYVDPETEQLKLGAHFGVRDKEALLANRASDGGVIRRMLSREQPLFASRIEAHDLSSDFVDREAIRSCAALPLRAEDEKVGVMFLNYRHPHRFTDEEQFLFEVLADLAAASIRDAALLEFAKQQREDSELSQQAAEVAATACSRDEALRGIMKLLQQRYPGVAIAIYAFESAEHWLKVDPASLDFYPFESVSETGILRVDDSSIAGHVAQMALKSRDFEIYNCPDASRDRYFRRGTEGMNSELCASLMSVSRDLLGVLILESPNYNAFREDHQEQIRGIARQISLVMERAQLEDQLRFQTSLAMATGGFVDFAHVARSELLKVRRRARWLSQKEFALSERGRRWSQEAEESAARLQQVFSAAQMGDADAMTEPLPCDALVRELFEEACAQRPAARLGLEWSLQCGDVRVAVNRKALQWVLDHLVGNAIEAGGDHCRLTVGTQLGAGQWAVVRIQDHGRGVDPQVRQFLFRQAIPNRPGRGTGLLRVRQLIESMGGTVRLLDSQSGRGATFAITLRVAQT